MQNRMHKILLSIHYIIYTSSYIYDDVYFFQGYRQKVHSYTTDGCKLLCFWGNVFRQHLLKIYINITFNPVMPLLGIPPVATK